MVLRDDGGCRDLGDPSVTQLDDGRVFVSYLLEPGRIDERHPLHGRDFLSRTLVAGSAPLRTPEQVKPFSTLKTLRLDGSQVNDKRILQHFPLTKPSAR